MIPRPLCPFPGRERGLFEPDDLTPAELRAWAGHLEVCDLCAEDAALLEASAEALLPRARAAYPSQGGAASAAREGRARARRVWAWAIAATLLLGLGTWLVFGGRGGRGPTEAERYREAWRLVAQADYPAALREAEALLAERRDRARLLQVGVCLLRLGRSDEAAERFREAERAADAPAPDGSEVATWYVRSHLAQALLAGTPPRPAEEEAERIAREGLAGPGLGPVLHRCLLWARLFHVRALGAGDPDGAAAYLAAAEAENLRYRAASLADPEIRAEEDSHYVLEARFLAAQTLAADAAATRAAALELRRAKEQVAARSRGPARSSYLADGREDEALAELLAARRGEPADLAKARALLEEALVHRTEGGNREGQATVRWRLAWLHRLAGEAKQGLGPAETAEAAAAASGLPEVIADARLVRIDVLAAAGHGDDARRLLDDSRGLAAFGDPRRRLAVAALEATLSSDAQRRASALALLEGASRSSPLADLRRVATLALAEVRAGRGHPVGPLDLGFAP